MTEIKGNRNRQLVTFALFAYNQEEYIREAVEGAFSQTYEPLEIILSDDCSTDSTFSIMQEMADAYRGRHRVTLRRNRKNLGLASHVNVVLEQSHSEIVLMAAGDDISLPDRTSLSVDIFNRNPEATAVLLSAHVINNYGDIVGEKLISGKKKGERTQNVGDLLVWQHVTFGAARAFRREVFTNFGPLREDCPTEDTPLLLRSLMCGNNILSAQKGLLYRRHENNLSSTASLYKMNIDAIYEQYRDDIEKAEVTGHLTAGVANMLLRWSPIDRKARDVRLMISIRKRLSFSDYIFVLRHPSFSFKDRFRLTVRQILDCKV